MRWGHRGLIVLVAASVVVGGCSSDDDPSAADVRAERSSTTVGRSSTSTTAITADQAREEGTSSTGAPGSARTGANTGTRRSSGAAPRPAGATATTRPPSTTTTQPCSVTSGSAPDLSSVSNPNDTRPAQVVIRNSHGASVVVGLAGATYTLPPGGSTTASVSKGRQSVTAAPSADPAKRFTYAVPFVAGATHTLTVRTVQVSSCAGRVDISQTDFKFQSAPVTTTSAPAPPPSDDGGTPQEL